MKNKSSGILLCTCLLLLLAACSDTLTPPSSDTNIMEYVISFTLLDQGDWPGKAHNPRITFTTKDSSGYRNLTNGFLTAPPVSTKMAFVRGQSVVILNFATVSETVPFTVTTPRTSIHNVVLSPDGQKITFTLYDSTIANVYTAHTTYIININGTSKIALPVSADISSTQSFPQFSPDGTLLALFHTVPSNANMIKELFITDTEGKNPPRSVASLDYYWKYTPAPAVCAWSPDGTKLAYSLKNTIRITDRTGNDVTPFASPVTGLFPAWSPDGKLLAFSATGTSASSLDLFSIKVSATAQPVQLTDVAAQGGNAVVYPQWSPNGKYILYTVYRDTIFKSDGMLYVLTIANRTTKQLATNAFTGFWITLL